ncbi:peptidoglycan editing factor PgeF [Aquibacillus koreensis]|uniref:Purine nucleoside phosphorylase n=1 Tax=Aquibacillus koreensis TaxID=279446 RepID=A0A9X3WKY1_9BACI|nr:peptidoglycan editing factor PgeF [Aquibacillus koreensis]MCT2538047.1 peptidoglycan editing factor PgeF [Aquibacillus koreensis]MDC3420570.1 peptidoglycan editing factor PgeF [Aquibacillus koreensis]
MEPFEKADERDLLIINEWTKLNEQLIAGITTRHGGVSSAPFRSMNLGFHVPDNHEDVLVNRQIISRQLQIPLEKWVMGQQTHGTSVAIVSDQDAGRGAKNQIDSISGVDGLITNEKGLLCTAMFADCVPVYFFDPKTGWIGIAHAGWRGTVNQIVVQVINSLVEQGSHLRDVMVVIGPCIGKHAYEVDKNVIDHIPDSYKPNVVTRKTNGHYLLDLRQLNKDILMDLGLEEKNIAVSQYCTYEDQMFFSHRRDQGLTGRMLGFVGYKV